MGERLGEAARPTDEHRVGALPVVENVRNWFPERPGAAPGRSL